MKKAEKKLSLSEIILVLSLGGLLLVPFIEHQLGYSTIEKEDTRILLKTLETDFARIEAFGALNPYLYDCVLERKGGEFNVAYELCAQKVKQENNDPRELFNRDVVIVQRLLGNKVGPLDEKLTHVDISLYELWNNQMILTSWRYNGCPDKISVLKVQEGELNYEYFVSRGLKDEKCMLIAEGVNDFLTRNLSNTNAVSNVRESLIKYEDGGRKEIVIPGDNQKIDDYFLETNNSHFKIVRENLRDIYNETLKILNLEPIGTSVLTE